MTNSEPTPAPIAIMRAATTAGPAWRLPAALFELADGLAVEPPDDPPPLLLEAEEPDWVAAAAASWFQVYVTPLGAIEETAAQLDEAGASTGVGVVG